MKNIYQYRLKNKRITVAQMEDETFIIECANIKSKSYKDASAVDHVVFKDVLHIDAIRLTKQSLIAIMECARKLILDDEKNKLK